MNKEKYKLTTDLKLIKFPVQEEIKMMNNSNIHHLWILDRSGSMYGALPKIIQDLKKQARTLQKGDALSFGYFSSRGQFGFPIKLFRIVDENSFAELDKLFDQHKTTLGLTCFSEILIEAINTIKGAEFLNLKTVSLFFSDGYANDRSREEEYRKVREIMPQLGQLVDMFLSVAHTNYADKDFLSEMAELTGGESVGSDSLESFTRIMDRFLRSSSKLTPRQVVKIDVPTKDIIAIFSYGDDVVNSFVPREDGLVQSNKDVWVLTKENNLDGGDEFVPLETQYACALVLSRKGKVDLALDILNQVGDKYLIDKLNNAITPSERGVIEDEIKDVIFNENIRFRDGKVFNYLPDPNAFCVLDLIELLSNDPNARFYPRHPEFKYNSIGRKPIMREGYEKFNAYLDNSCPISSFSWNKEFLNLSILATVKGTVKLNNKVERYDIEDNGENTVYTFNKPSTLGDIKETYQWKNYTLVKDGFLNIEKLPISASIKTLFELRNNNLIPSQNEKGEYLEVSENRVYILDLTKLPIINKAITSQEISAKELLSNVLEENILQAQIKVLNSLRKEIAPDTPKVQNNWTEKEREFLLVSGFREDGSYSPPYDLEESTDVYDAVSFKVGIKSLSSLPSLNDLRKKMEEIKSADSKLKKQPELNLGMTLMAPTLENYEAQVKSLSVDDQIKWIENELTARKLVLNKIRSSIQRCKFTLLLGKKWFSDLENSEAEQTVNFSTSRINGKSELTGVIQIFRKEVKI